jgi:nucleotide-binding universal stress UspA family protein
VAFDLARQFRFDVHLLHVLPRGSADSIAADRARREMATLVPPDAGRPPVVHVQAGNPARAIGRVADEIGAVCIVMGEHRRTPLRHWFRPDATQAVLHPARCPIWYVPGRAPVARPADASPRPRVDALQDPQFHYWPSSQLYGVVDSSQEAESALADLVAAGVQEDQLHTWHGPAGAAALDPTGRHHGRTAQIWRTLEKATPERDLLQEYSREIEQGHVCIGVRCSGGPERRVLTDILQRHHGHLISYFSVGSVERLTR